MRYFSLSGVSARVWLPYKSKIIRGFGYFYDIFCPRVTARQRCQTYGMSKKNTGMKNLFEINAQAAGRPDDPDPDTGIAVKPKAKTKKPSMYRVLLLNDDYTPMEFVVHVLERFFGKNRQEATDIMLMVHRRGVGVCGVFTYEVAETKVSQVMEFSKQNEHPLQCAMERE